MQLKDYLLSFLLFSTCINYTLSQDKNDWIDSTLQQIIHQETQAFDIAFKPLEISNIVFCTIDTSFNCMWTRPRFFNNIYQHAFGGVAIPDAINFDTITNKVNSDFIDFRYKAYDSNGKYLGYKASFLVNRNMLQKSRKENNFLSFKMPLNGTIWKLQKVFNYGHIIKLDSCHQIYRLELATNQKFCQYYINEKSYCATESMHSHIEVGLEGDLFFLSYFQQLQGHYLNPQQGIWQVEKDKLLLIDPESRYILTMKFERVNKQTLILYLDEHQLILQLVE